MPQEKYYIITFKHDPRYGMVRHGKPTGDMHFAGHAPVRMCRLEIGADEYTVSKGMTKKEAEEIIGKMKQIVFPCSASQKRTMLFHEAMHERNKAGLMKGFDTDWITQWNDDHPFTKFEHELYMAAYLLKETPTIKWLIDWLNAYEEKHRDEPDELPIV